MASLLGVNRAFGRSKGSASPDGSGLGVNASAKTAGLKARDGRRSSRASGSRLRPRLHSAVLGDTRLRLAGRLRSLIPPA